MNPALKFTTRVLALAEWALTSLLLFVIRAYQSLHVAFFRGSCRFHPTCSHYALEAIQLHGPGRGTLLTAWRVLRCQPFCRGGFDPVPEPKQKPQKQSGRNLNDAGRAHSRQDRSVPIRGVLPVTDFSQHEILTQSAVGTQRERARQGGRGSDAGSIATEADTVSRRSQQVPQWRLS